jgi:peptide/nickel transport system substrate-binding protein
MSKQQVSRLSKQQVSRREFLRLVSLAAGGVALAACQPQTVVVEKEVEKEVTTVVEVEKEVTTVVEKEKIVEKEVEKEVTTVVEVEKVVTATPEPTEQVLIGAFSLGPGGCPQCWNPIVAGNRVGAWWTSKLWSPLALLSIPYDNATVEPELAESWESNEDATVWTVYLRKGLEWDDGEPLTVNDIAYYHKRIQFNPAVTPVAPLEDRGIVGARAFYDGETEEIEGVTVLDDFTIEFQYITPQPFWPRQYLTGLVEYAEHHLADLSDEEIALGTPFTEARPCSGPFSWGTWEVDQYFEGVANDRYWRGRPKLDKIIDRYFPNETTAVLALQRGEIDFTYISGDVVRPLKEAGDFTVFAGLSFVPNWVFLNHREPMIQDIRVRQAMYHAIDRELIIDTLYDGSAIRLKSLYATEPETHPDCVMWEYDPDQAKALLEEAGFQQDKEWIMLTYYSSQLSQNVMQAMQQMWAEVGIQVVPRPLEVGMFRDQFRNVSDTSNWTIAYIGGGLGRERHHKEGQPLAVGPDCPGSSHGCYEGMEEMSQILDDMQIAPSIEATFELRREASLIMNQKLPDLYMWMTERYGAANNRVQNFFYYPSSGGAPFRDGVETWEIVD